MDTINSQADVSVMAVLNFNRVVEDKIKEAIKAMGLGACQVRCISHQCSGHYHSRH